MSEPIFRRPTLADAEDTLALMIRCDVAEYGEPDSDLEDLTYEWDQIDLRRDAWLAFDPANKVAGYAAVRPAGDALQFDLYADPDYPDSSLSEKLLAHCLTRGRELATDRQGQIIAKTYVAHSNQRDIATFRGAGFEPGRYIFQMQITLDRRPPEAVWPAETTVRAVIPGSDDRPLYEFIQEAFYQPGRTPQAFEDWLAFMMRPDIFEAELWSLVFSGKDIIGACLAYAYPDTGWVRQLAVAKSWRGQGLGEALLRGAFLTFYERGYPSVGLGVESRRPDAHAFYQKVGMRQVRQYDEFQKPILSS